MKDVFDKTVKNILIENGLGPSDLEVAAFKLGHIYRQTEINELQRRINILVDLVREANPILTMDDLEVE